MTRTDFSHGIWTALPGALLLLLLAGAAPVSAAGHGGGRLPIFDTHLHYSQAAWDLVSAKEARALLEKAFVPRALVSSSPDDGSLTLHREDPQRFVPVLRPYRASVGLSNWFSDEATPGYLQGRLEQRSYQGIGEFHLSSEADARTEVVRRVARLAAERGIMLHVHADAGPVRVLFEHEPEVRILWAHAGMVTAVAEIGRMIGRYKNLWAELSFREWEISRGGTLDETWRRLLTDYTARFMIGTDTYANHRWEEYAALVDGHRRWLALMPSEKARDIAYRNAARMFGWGRLQER